MLQILLLDKGTGKFGRVQLLPYRTALDMFQKYKDNNTCKIRKIAKKKYFILRTTAQAQYA